GTQRRGIRCSRKHRVLYRLGSWFALTINAPHASMSCAICLRAWPARKPTSIWRCRISTSYFLTMKRTPEPGCLQLEKKIALGRHSTLASANMTLLETEKRDDQANRNFDNGNCYFCCHTCRGASKRANLRQPHLARHPTPASSSAIPDNKGHDQSNGSNDRADVAGRSCA